MKFIVVDKMLPVFLPIFLILSSASCGTGFQHGFSNIEVHHTAGYRRNLLLNKQTTALLLQNDYRLLALDNDRMLDGISFQPNDRIVATRRTWCRNALITISVATITTVGTSGKPSSAMEASIPASEAVDPLVTFGESLSSKNSGGVNSIRPISSSWPDNAAHPLPTLADPFVPPSTTKMESQQPPALEQVLQQSQLKKQINPTTHG